MKRKKRFHCFALSVPLPGFSSYAHWSHDYDDCCGLLNFFSNASKTSRSAMSMGRLCPMVEYKHGLFCFCLFLTFGKFICRGCQFDLFSTEGRGFESKSVTDTRATTDKNDPFLNMGFKHGKKWVDKNGAKCNMEFGRITKNNPRGSHSMLRSTSAGSSSSLGLFLFLFLFLSPVLKI